MSESEAATKAAKAKMYNLRSGIEGLIQMLDAGIMSAGQAIDGAAAFTAKLVEDWNKNSG